MNLLTYALITHVISGVIAIGLIHLVFMHLIKKSPNWRYLSAVSLSSVILFLVSWVTSAFYYVTYYGKSVKPKIVEGPYPWAHQIFMEAKEHIFILIPFLAISLYLCIKILEKNQDDRFKKAVSILALIALILGTFVAGAGILVSGAVR